MKPARQDGSKSLQARSRTLWAAKVLRGYRTLEPDLSNDTPECHVKASNLRSEAFLEEMAIGVAVDTKNAA